MSERDMINGAGRDLPDEYVRLTVTLNTYQSFGSGETWATIVQLSPKGEFTYARAHHPMLLSKSLGQLPEENIPSMVSLFRVLFSAMNQLSNVFSAATAAGMNRLTPHTSVGTVRLELSKTASFSPSIVKVDWSHDKCWPSDLPSNSALRRIFEEMRKLR